MNYLLRRLVRDRRDNPFQTTSYPSWKRFIAAFRCLMMETTQKKRA